jgi:DNA-binding CsgD family transcriptional regulator
MQGGGPMPIEIVGRDEEVASVRAFVEGAAERPAALVLEGEAGVGKSTLWRAGVEHACAEGLQVLVSRPAEAERDLPHVALGDLLEEAVDDVLPALPAPRRRALELALLHGERSDEPLDARALAVATRTALELLADERPVLVAIDDVQWLDASSARVLAFALRRLGEVRLRLLLTRRLGDGSFAAGVEEAFGPGRVDHLRVRPLSMGAIQRLLHMRLGTTFPRPLLVRLHEGSGGNPFYALELGRALAAEPPGNPAEPLPVPESLEGVARERLAGLQRGTRAALAVVAATGRAPTELLRAAGVADEALDPAFAARVVETQQGVVTFTHPLLASALYGDLTPAERERAHDLLAKVVDDPLARARHLALAASAPDEQVAAAVEGAASAAAAQAANVAAAELGAHAVRLTPPDEGAARHRRAVAAVRLHLLAGDAGRARADAERLLAEPLAPRQRADVLLALSDVEETGFPEQAIALRKEALAALEGEPAMQASIHAWLAWRVRSSEGLAAAEAHARTALGLAERVGDDGLRAGALSVLNRLRFNAGAPDALDLAEQALDAAAASGRRERCDEASFDLAHALLWSSQLDRARTLLERLCAELSLRDEVATGEALWYLSLVELGAGRLTVAAEHADRQRELARLYATDERENALAIWVVARVAAHRGELDRAGELAERSLALAVGQPQFVAGQEGVLGLVAAWSGRPADAVEHFSVADELRYEMGIRSPGMYWWRAEQVEALLELGRIDTAVALLDTWEADAARLGLDGVLAQAARCRGLVAAARGDVSEGTALLEEAVARHESVGDPFGRARALLALGALRRRDRQKRAAREAIDAAAEAFESMGAAGWAEKARSELGRIGGRVREPGLTAAESRVAALVAEGRTNREVAAALFLGERTVETHLSHVYAKLGVRSRSELARTYRPDEQSSGGLTISS